MLDIRTAEKKDFPALAVLERLCFSQPWSEDAFRSFEENGGVILAATENGTVWGYLTAAFAGGEGEIANIAVSPEHRRQGVARALLFALEQEAAKAKVSALFLEVRLSNAAAQRLYETAGFREVGRRKRFYALPTEDALIYRKDIQNEDPGF